jgi:hypothetical protein
MTKPRPAANLALKPNPRGFEVTTLASTNEQVLALLEKIGDPKRFPHLVELPRLKAACTTPEHLAAYNKLRCSGPLYQWVELLIGVACSLVLGLVGTRARPWRWKLSKT